METVIRFSLGNLSYFFVVLAFLGPLIHIRVKRIKTTKEQIDIALSYILFFGIGFQGIYAFWGHAFIPAVVAESIGWPPAPKFQFELAFANLAIGVLGILSVWNRDGFRLATIISVSIFLFGCAYGHVRDIILYANYSPNNSGIVLFMDIFFPLYLIVLYYFYKKEK